MLISEMEPFYKIIFCFKFHPALLRKNFYPWNIRDHKDKSSVLNEPYLQLPFLLLLQIIAIFPWL